MESVFLKIINRRFVNSLCVSLVFSAFFVMAKKPTVELKLGDIPPAYLGKTNGKVKINLNDYKGKVVVVTFWASWCKPCLQELPILDRIQKKLGDNIKIFAVNFKQDRKLYRKIRHKLKDISLTMLHDPMGFIGKKFGVKSIPNLFILSKEGKIAYHSIGYGEKTLDKILFHLNKELAQ